eukprot:TRINITY_DN5010_c0_g1_i6.p1 TRINITY_DN5010_c0_g1~~TRINITY_DN5010_c0_g1_i6.p1  ORF type:complete len:161 (-),score=23.35 TRINITY_DN5010_c0_g1_i6:441-923(-)
MGLLLPTTTSVIKQAHQQEVSDCNEMLDEIYVSKKQALVLGTPGSGKTTFLQTLKFLYSRGETFLLLLSSSLDKKSHMAKLPKEVLFIIASIYLQIPDNPSSVEECQVSISGSIINFVSLQYQQIRIVASEIQFVVFMVFVFMNPVKHYVHFFIQTIHVY